MQIILRLHKLFKPGAIFGIILGIPCLFSMAAHAQDSEHPIDIIIHNFEENYITADEAVISYFSLFNQDVPAHPYRKCATPGFIMAERNRDRLSKKALDVMESFRASGTASSVLNQQRVLTESGRFEIFYYTDGEDAVPAADENSNGLPDYVEWAMEAAEFTYEKEISEIGFIDPVIVGEPYKITLRNLPNGVYGFTAISGSTTVMEVDNDFVGSYGDNTNPEGRVRGALEVTIAHEFKHAIQYETSRWRGSSGRVLWSEMDATMMEEIVYDDVNDYYNYIKEEINSSEPNSQSIFGQPSKSTPGSYNFVTWMLYYAEAYGMDLWKRIWDEIEANNFLSIVEGLKLELPGGADEYPSTMLENHVWHFASGERSQFFEGGFDEKLNYPNANVTQSLNFVPESSVVIDDLPNLAANYFEIYPSAADKGIADIAIEADSQLVEIAVLNYLRNGTVERYNRTADDIDQVYVPTNENWEDLLYMGIIITNSNEFVDADPMELVFGKNGNRFKINDPQYANLPDEFILKQNYPNPFNPITTIEYELSQPSRVVLEVFDITGRRVQTLFDGSRPAGMYSQQFDASSLSSGVYIYRLRTTNDVFSKKMLLIK